MDELIAKRYVKALAESVSDLKAVAAILNALAKAMSAKEVKEAIASPLVSAEKKIDLILSALGSDVDSKIVNFIKILGENKRIDLIPVIAKVLNADLQKASNKYEGVIETQEKLDAGAIKKLEKALHQYTGAKIKLSQKKSDLDGLHVIVDDLGVEVNFSKKRVQEQLIDFIVKSI
ncbi:MAG: F0F1 ATP synthase subunit delta [Sulfurovum sp.]|nr:MAG: F0F1 ATP synthase subunit delta [Sulfurovum sp.]